MPIRGVGGPVPPHLDTGQLSDDMLQIQTGAVETLLASPMGSGEAEVRARCWLGMPLQIFGIKANDFGKT
jgi:hypothetical protein